MKLKRRTKWILGLGLAGAVIAVTVGAILWQRAFRDYTPAEVALDVKAALVAKEGLSYEWNQFLNGASYDRPQEWTDVTWSIVEEIFGGRLNTPLIGDAEPVHGEEGVWVGKNALYFDGRVDRTRRDNCAVSN